MPENTGAGVDIGAAVAAEDPEDDSLVYSLSGPDAAAFTIVEDTGQLRTSGALDFETKPTHTFTIEVHDGRRQRRAFRPPPWTTPRASR